MSNGDGDFLNIPGVTIMPTVTEGGKADPSKGTAPVREEIQPYTGGPAIPRQENTETNRKAEGEAEPKP